MKRILQRATLVLMLAGVVALPAAAQHITPEQMEETVVRLNLTEAQKQSVRPIIEAGVRERMQILQDAGIRPGEKPGVRQLMRVRGPMTESRERTEARLSQVLEPAQMQEYRAIVEEQRQKMRQQFQ